LAVKKNACGVQRDEVLHLKKRKNHHVEKALPKILGALDRLLGDPAKTESPLQIQTGEVLVVGDNAEQMFLRSKYGRLGASRTLEVANQAANVKRRCIETILICAPADLSGLQNQRRVRGQPDWKAVRINHSLVDQLGSNQQWVLDPF